MTRHSLLPLVLALAMGTAPVLAAAHGDHAGAEPAHGCATCVYAAHADAGATPVPPALPAPIAAALPPPDARTAVAAVARRHHPIRGPPALPC